MAGTTTYTFARITPGLEKHTWSAVADASTGAVLSKSSDNAVSGLIIAWECIPGVGVAPTAGWSPTIKDANTLPILGGAMAGQAATIGAGSQGMPLVGATYAPKPVNSILTMAEAVNIVHSATFDVILWVATGAE